MMKRRKFLTLGTLLPVAAVGGSNDVLAQRAGSNACLPSVIPVRKSSSVEIAYKSPHGFPNGLAQGPNDGELWVQDRGLGRQVSLIRAVDGSLIREIKADAIGPSGVTMDDDGMMWTSDTHGVMLVAFDANDGHTIAKYFVPGACRMYEKVGDAPRRDSPLPLAYPNESRAMSDNLPHNEFNDTGSGLGPGRVPLQTDHFWSSTGPTGIISKGDLLIYSCLSARAIFTVHKNSWQVQDVWPTPGNRPLGLCWADKSKTSFWSADANLQTLYRFDASTGVIHEAISLPLDGPLIHGCQIVGEHMYFTDDKGWICRFKV